jgi:ribosome biogenesis GTPase
MLINKLFEVSIKGLITKIESKDYYVLTGESKTHRCTLRGKFKKEFELKKDKLFITDIAAVGDIVDFEKIDDGTGVIQSIEQRKNYISRKAPKTKGSSYRGDRLEQIIAANIDQVVIFCSVNRPKFNNKTLDRFLVATESANVGSVIVINKSDLDIKNKILKWKSLYEDIGYSVIVTSYVNETGIEDLKKILLKKKTLFWGQSGVGKSSLMNILFPGLDLKVGNISNYTGKGKHTTVTSIMIPIDSKTFIIDTPGIREIDPYGIKKEDLGHYFIDFKEYISLCKFNTCTHTHEPGCVVIDAAENGDITLERYDSYLRIKETIEDDIHF